MLLLYVWYLAASVPLWSFIGCFGLRSMTVSNRSETIFLLLFLFVISRRIACCLLSCNEPCLIDVDAVNFYSTTTMFLYYFLVSLLPVDRRCPGFP